MDTESKQSDQDPVCLDCGSEKTTEDGAIIHRPRLFGEVGGHRIVPRQVAQSVGALAPKAGA